MSSTSASTRAPGATKAVAVAGGVQVPYKQIRARQPTRETVIVYQAYSAEIADAAVASQKLDGDGSGSFRVGRMTWIKPSFLWCMYRSGWSYKDVNQARILAIEMRVAGLCELVRCASSSSSSSSSSLPPKEKEKVEVRFQWDPERGVRLERLPYRSLQLGIGGGMVRRWIDEWIVRIEDVTEDVRRFHALIESEGDQGAKKVAEELQGEKWREDVLQLGEELEGMLGMPGGVA